MDFQALVQLGLLLVRISTLVATTPILGGSFAPPMVKVGLSLLLVLVVAPVVPVPAAITAASLPIVALHELLVGFALALSVRTMLAAAELGGYLVGFQLGFSYAGIVDPQSGVRNNVLASLYSSITALALIGTNAHHVLIRALVRSYEHIPLGAGGVHESIAGTVTRMLGVIFYVGAQLAAPVTIVLVVVEVMLGVVTRAAPSLNLMAIGAPLRLLLGLLTLIVAVQVLPATMIPLIGRAIELGVQLAAGLR
jgi:flagellar biosynthetic protein FliR